MDGTSDFWVEDDGQAFTPRTKRKAKRKVKFNGWGSRELIDFLNSIGKDVSKPLSHYDVTNIVNQYIIDNKLIHPEKKKRAVCDERLQVLFGGKKQSVFRNKIQNLLEPHFPENHVDSEEDAYSSDEDEDFSASKRQKISTVDTKTLPRKKEVSKSSLAAICPENIKLIYLKRSLVQEFLKHPQTFESKVVGSFVKTKPDPYDIYQKNSHQLQLVTGVKDVSLAGDNRAAMLQLANMSEGMRISALSDDNFSEEECEDLRRRFNDGSLKHPTVGELEKKVAILHEDLTRHWLARELVLLKIRTDQANEKGWRYKVTEYLDRRKLLETPAEQSRLLNEIPTVIPVKVDPETVPDNPPDCVDQNTVDSPKTADWEWEPSYNSSAIEVPANVSSKHGSQGLQVEVGSRSNGNIMPSIPHEGSQLQMEQVRTQSNGHLKPLEPNKTSMLRIEIPRIESNCHAESESLSAVQRDVSGTETVGAEKNAQLLPCSNGRDPPRDPIPKSVEVITLSDDEDEPEIASTNAPALPDPECYTWYYLDPTSRVQGPFPLSLLKRWSDLGYFQPGFRVWASGQRPDEAILLSYILQRVFPS
ncbi:uncharacterized protein At5g08430-like [Silene latifolia]|uniref:uncharacterized protein At5g08430-like n=1 Tax=Silene latifolia TaxID=37657 RepID=UPI003D772C4F